MTTARQKAKQRVHAANSRVKKKALVDDAMGKLENQIKLTETEEELLRQVQTTKEKNTTSKQVERASLQTKLLSFNPPLLKETPTLTRRRRDACIPLVDREIEPAPDITATKMLTDSREIAFWKCEENHKLLMEYLKQPGLKNFKKLHKLLRDSGCMFDKEGCKGRASVGFSRRLK
jgi:hypothetical protein